MIQITIDIRFTDIHYLFLFVFCFEFTFASFKSSNLFNHVCLFAPVNWPMCPRALQSSSQISPCWRRKVEHVARVARVAYDEMNVNKMNRYICIYTWNIMKLYLQGISDSKEIILENFNQSESIECHRVPLIFSPGSEDGDFVSGRTPWTSGKAGANLRWSQAQRNAEPEQNRTRLRNNWNEASKQDSKQSGFFSGWFCSWKRSGTKNLLISIYQYISCHFCFLKSGAAQLNVNAETRMFFLGIFICDLRVFLILLLAFLLLIWFCCFCFVSLSCTCCLLVLLL